MNRRRPFFLAIAAIALTVLSNSSVRGEGCAQWQIAQVTPPSTGFVSATWANGEFWAFGDKAYVSTTGTVWTALGPRPGLELVQVRWTGTAFVALGNYGTLATSQDGLGWTQWVYVGDVPSTVLSDVAWNGSTYVVVGFRATESSGAYGHPIIMVSSDLFDWAGVSVPAGGGDREELSGVVWTGARFVAVGQNQSGGVVGNVVFVSDDGRTWTRLTGPGGASVAWSGHELVAVGGWANSMTVWRSADGLTWQSAALNQAWDLTAVAWDGSRFVAVGGATILVSPDGSTWKVEPVSISDNLVAVAAYLGTDVAVGQKGTIVAANCFGGEPLYLPAAAHLPGINGSMWRTDVEVHNPGSAQVGYTVELLVRDGDNSAPDARSFTLDPGKSVRYADALASVFGFGGAGTLRVMPFGGTVMTSARTYDDAPGGSFGQFVEGQPATAAITTSRTARMIQLAQASDRSAGFRTNLGLVSASAGAMSVEVDLFRADGVALGELTVPLRPFESVQRIEVFREVASDAVDDGYIVVRTTTDGGRFFAYATLIDNRSNDPVYIPAR